MARGVGPTGALVRGIRSGLVIVIRKPINGTPTAIMAGAFIGESLALVFTPSYSGEIRSGLSSGSGHELVVSRAELCEAPHELRTFRGCGSRVPVRVQVQSELPKRALHGAAVRS